MVKTTAHIDGMACGMCESHVCDAVRNTFSNITLKKVKASAKKGELEIIADEAIDFDALKLAIDPTGYTVLDAASEPYEKRGLFGR